MPDHVIGIVDLGGARFKAAAYQVDGAPQRVWHTSVETGDLVKAEQAGVVRDTLRGLVAEVRQHADRIVAYGAGLLRQPRWRDELVPLLEQIADETFVLDPQREGQLLLLAAQRNGGGASHLVDIGGESVQLVAQHDQGTAEVSSWPVGTFAIERIWGLSQGSPVSAYEAAAKDLRATFALRPVVGSRLAVGTGLMAQFLERLALQVGVDQADRWRAADLDQAWRFCAQLPRERFAEVFPAKPGFMYGADKAMLIAWVIAGQLDAAEAHGTAASVMDGVAWTALGLASSDRVPRPKWP